MSDPRRLLDEASGFEAELLRAGRGDALPAQSASTISAALGVAPPIMSSTLGTGAKLAASKVVAGLIGVGAAGALSVWAALQLLAPPVTPTPQKPPEAGRAAVVADAPALRPTFVEVPGPVLPPKPSMGSRSVASPERDNLPLELEALDRARSALAGGDAPRALGLLDEYQARFPKARLRAESAVLRIEALVARGQKDAAIRLGRELLAREPNGPYARRVRSLLERAGAPATR